MRNIKRVISLSARLHLLDKSGIFQIDKKILTAINNTPNKHKEISKYLKVK